jgi:hypothetical protein
VPLLAGEAGMIRMEPMGEPPPPSPDADESVRAAALPVEYALAQNYPNPFNPTTTITFQLPGGVSQPQGETYRVLLRIYNVVGQVVATLVDGVQEAGYKSASFDASRFASGIYFYRLEAASITEPSHSFSSVKKMMLLK